MVGILTILRVVVGSQMCACVETHHTVHFTRTQCGPRKAREIGSWGEVEARPVSHMTKAVSPLAFRRGLCPLTPRCPTDDSLLSLDNTRVILSSLA